MLHALVTITRVARPGAFDAIHVAAWRAPSDPSVPMIQVPSEPGVGCEASVGTFESTMAPLDSRQTVFGKGRRSPIASEQRIGTFGRPAVGAA